MNRASFSAMPRQGAGFAPVMDRKSPLPAQTRHPSLPGEKIRPVRGKTDWSIVPAAEAHIAPIAANMRDADRREVWASNRHRPDEALFYSLVGAERAWTCFVDGAPAFMWGVTRPGGILCTRGIPWLLGTDAIVKVRREFLRQSRAYVERMAEGFKRLENRVHADNALSIRWLVWCGFTLDDEPVFINGEMFHFFWRDICVTPQ